MAKEAVVDDKAIADKVTKDLVKQADEPKGQPPKKIKNASVSGKDGVKEVGKDHEGKILVTSTDPNFNGLPWSYDPDDYKKGVNLYDGKNNTPFMQIYPDKTALTDRDIAALETPFVVVNGMAIMPTRTGLVIHRGEIVEPANNNKRASYTRTDFSLYGLDDTAITEFNVNIDGKLMTIYLDNKSSVVMDITKLGHGDDYDYYISRRDAVNSEIVLINAHSMNNLFMGPCHLRNVEVTNSIINRSLVRAVREKQGFHYGTRRGELNYMSAAKDYPHRRHQYNRIRLRRSQITDSQLPEGFYSKTQVVASTIVADRNLRVTDSYIDHSDLKAGTMHLERANVTESNVSCETHLTLRNVNMNNEHIHQRALTMLNKFCLLKVDLPTDTLTMGRSSATEVDIYIFTGTPKRVLMSATREEIEKVVSEIIMGRAYRWEEAPPAPDNNPLAQSIIKYAVDAVMSRLEMMRVLDSATEIVRTIEGRYDNWDDVLDN